MDYLTIKWLHILSSTILFGTGLGTAFYFFVANRSGKTEVIAEVAKWVVRADWWFTTPTVIAQPVTGCMLIAIAGFDWQQRWIVMSLLLYTLAGLCWLPVVVLQLRMRDMAQYAQQHHQPLPARYWRYEKYWIVLGVPAFSALVFVYWLMVNKPA